MSLGRKPLSVFLPYVLPHDAEIQNEPEDQFYGERSGWLRDPSGHRWNVGHFLDEVTPEEMQRRFTAMMTGTDS